MEFTGPRGRERYDALVQVAGRSVVGLDFDGTLSPIVDDPARARIHPDATDVLGALGVEVAAVAVITGRPARQALDLGELEPLGARLGEQGAELFIFGQYGNERWRSSSPEVLSPPPPPGLAAYLDALPQALAEAGEPGAHVEEKGLAVAVHTRRLPDPDAAYDALLPVLSALAARHGLQLEPGKHVLEVRGGEMHKGMAVQQLVDDLDAAGFLFAGDDLGDVEAFEAVERLAVERGLAALLVCSASEESSVLAPLADVVVPGPEGVLALLGMLADDVRAQRA